MPRATRKTKRAKRNSQSAKRNARRATSFGGRWRTHSKCNTHTRSAPSTTRNETRATRTPKGRQRTCDAQHVTHQEQRDAPNCKQRQCATRDAQHSTCNTQRATRNAQRVNHKAGNAARNSQRRKVQNAAAHHKQKHHKHKHHQHKQQNSPWDGFRVSEPAPLPPPLPVSLNSQSTTPRGHSQDCHRCQEIFLHMHSAIARCIACCSSSPPPAPLPSPHSNMA